MVNITNPFQYQELKRQSVDGKRLYENPWGDPVPSVTTILDATKPAEKRKALAAWKKRVGKEEAQRITPEYGSLTISSCKVEHEVTKITSGIRTSFVCFLSDYMGENRRIPNI